MRILAGLLLCSMLIIAIPGQAFAYSYSTSSNVTANTAVSAMSYQEFNSSMTLSKAQTFVKHFISNVTTYVKVPNSGSMSRYASDAVYKNIDLGSASKGCFHYANFIKMTMYRTAGERKYSSETAGKYTANGVKTFLQKEGQAGEHIRIDGKHSLSFIACTDDGFYTLQWYGNSRQPFLSYYSYSGFAKDLNSIGVRFWIYNADTADNTKIPGKINIIFAGTNCSNLPASLSVQKDTNGVGEFFLSTNKPVYLNYDPYLTYTFKGWQIENMNQLFSPGESVSISTNPDNLYQDTDVRFYPVWQKLKLFNDVPTDHWSYLHIGSLGAQGIVNGYSGTSDFKPNSSINRQEAAGMIANGANLTASNHFSTNFSDINKASSWAHSSIYALEQHGVISGFGGTNEFRAKNNIKRNHAAKMIVLAFNLKSGTKVVNLTDIKGVDCEEYIRILASNDIIGGYKGTSLFKPNEDISRAEFAKMVDLAMQIAGRRS